MDAALDIKTYTSTTSSPTLVSSWVKGLGTFPDREERIHNLKIRNKNHSVENINFLLEKADKKVHLPRVTINSAVSNNGTHNLLKAVDEDRLSTRYVTKIGSESASTALKVDSVNLETFIQTLIDSYGREENKSLIDDYLAACRKMILLKQPLRSDWGKETSESSLLLIDENEKFSASESVRNLETELNEQRVIEALKDPQWDFRTINGIAKETKLDSVFIENTVTKYSHKIRRSKVPNYNGEALFTLKNRPETLRERLALWLIFIKKSI